MASTGLASWFLQNWLIKWYAELAPTLSDPAARSNASRSLQTWFIMHQYGILANKGVSFGIVLVLCMVLYAGYNWVRWLWAAHWLARGIVGLFVTFVAYSYINVFNRLLSTTLLISVAYVACGLIMVFSPSVRVYMDTMRRPHGRVRYL
ncbi:MAG: hypothetical protein R2867_32995 [Caldilineaceae bacterium]